MRYFQRSLSGEAVYASLNNYKAVFEQVKLSGINFRGQINRKNKAKGRVEHKENKEGSHFPRFLLLMSPPGHFFFFFLTICSSEAVFSKVQLLKTIHCGAERIC